MHLDKFQQALADLGKLKSCQYCPVVKYMQAKVEPGIIMSVSYGTNGADTADFKVPKPVQDFIRAFDRGEYPDLRA